MKTRRAGRDAGVVPPLDKRLERFVQRYLDSPLKLDLLRCLAQRPNRAYTLGELADLTDSNVPDVERAVFSLERLGIVANKREREAMHVSLSRSPVVRETAVMAFRYTTRAGGYDHLRKMIRSKHTDTARRGQTKSSAAHGPAAVPVKDKA
jgi:hypothetical protein